MTEEDQEEYDYKYYDLDKNKFHSNFFLHKSWLVYALCLVLSLLIMLMSSLTSIIPSLWQFQTEWFAIAKSILIILRVGQYLLSIDIILYMFRIFYIWGQKREFKAWLEQKGYTDKFKEFNKQQK